MFNLTMTEGVRLGPIARVWVLSKAQVILGGARDVERILKDMRFHEKSDSYRFLHPWMGHGLLTSCDEKWRVHRKVLTPAFHFNILHEFLPIFNKHALKLTQCLAAESAATSKKGFDVFPYASLCALDIICGEHIFYSFRVNSNFLIQFPGPKSLKKIITCSISTKMVT
ncbi:hypothetical protein B566_EDAN014753 [Ephemera danica]|nr:hypothetical protein B566_EDAN014753 [Ephemera danica]